MGNWIPEITWQGLSQLLFSILGILTALLAFIVFSNASHTQNEVQATYIKFLNKMKKRGLVKLHTEGADDFCKRTSDKLPDDKFLIEHITLLYQQLRYKQFHAEQLTLLRKEIKRF